MRTRQFTIANPRGLHAEVCAQLVAIARHCRCQVFLVSRKQRVSARNIVAVMLLTASISGPVRIVADGPDEDVAIKKIAALLHDGNGERA